RLALFLHARAMMIKRSLSPRARALVAVLTAAVAILGLLSKLAKGEISAVGTPVALEGELYRGVMACFISYITGPWSEGGSYDVSDEVFDNDGVFVYSSATGTAKPDDVDVAFDGSVHFTAHGGVLDITVSNPRLQIDGDQGALVIDA